MKLANVETRKSEIAGYSQIRHEIDEWLSQLGVITDEAKRTVIITADLAHIEEMQVTYDIRADQLTLEELIVGLCEDLSKEYATDVNLIRKFLAEVPA